MTTNVALHLIHEASTAARKCASATYWGELEEAQRWARAWDTLNRAAYLELGAANARPAA